MEVLLLLVYAFFVWLIFFKLKLLPWNIVSQVIVVVLPVIALAATILFLNIVAPSTHDVRVINYVVQVVPRVTGHVVEVPVEPNRPVKKGDVLFRIDPTPFELEIKAIEANITHLGAKLVTAEANQRGLEEQLKGAAGTKEAIGARLALAQRRLGQHRELAAAGAGPRFDTEQAESDLLALQHELEAALAAESQVREKLSAKTAEGEQDEVAQVKAQILQARSQLADATWKLEQTVYYAPADGTVINLQLRPGAMAAQLPMRPVMTFVEREQWIIAMYGQNEVRNVEPGNEAEIALRTYPGRVIKCKVDSIVWATAQGQLPFGGVLPDTADHHLPEGRLAVRLMLDEREEGLFLAAGARGQGAIYTNHGAAIHILRKVIVRVGSKLDWFVPKLH